MMKPFLVSNDLLGDPPSLRKRLRDDGYLFLRGILPRDDVMRVRQQILKICQEAGWLRPGSDLIDGLTDRAPLMERDEEYKPVYGRVQTLEAFHKLKLHKNIANVMETIFQESVIPFPQTIGRIGFPGDNARGTAPHQDWIFVGGSVETITCWVPLGDIPMEVGGLKILEGSHKSGFLAPRPAAGPGGNTVDVDPRLDWVQSSYNCGDILLFGTLTVHAAAPNTTPDVMRFSADFRYTGESNVMTDEWLQPHFCDLGEPFTWDSIEKDWRDSPTAHYWDRLPQMRIHKPDRFWEK
jgi:hypothetical protein